MDLLQEADLDGKSAKRETENIEISMGSAIMQMYE